MSQIQELEHPIMFVYLHKAQYTYIGQPHTPYPTPMK